MTILEQVQKRSQLKCELCFSPDELDLFNVMPEEKENTENSTLLCNTCRGALNHNNIEDNAHWNCLEQSMWSEHDSVKILIFRLLSHLQHQSWAKELLDQLYLEEHLINKAKAVSFKSKDSKSLTKDSNGTILHDGDTVTLIKDLVVKGANFTAKRGTTVKKISLTDNSEQIEGRINGTRIVLLTCYLKKILIS